MLRRSRGAAFSVLLVLDEMLKSRDSGRISAPQKALVTVRPDCYPFERLGGISSPLILILQHRIKPVLLLGKDAQRSAQFLDLPSEVVVRKLPHPERLGLINFHENGARIGAVAAKQRVFEGFRLP